MFAEYFAGAWPRLKELEADGLLRLSRERVQVTERGRLLLRVIAMCFDAYLDAPQAVPARFSRAI